MSFEIIDTERFNCDRVGNKLQCKVNDQKHKVDGVWFKNGSYMQTDAETTSLFNYSGMKCVVTDIPRGAFSGKRMSCALPAKRMGWGFDNSGFGSAAEFNEFLKKHKFTDKGCVGYKDRFSKKVTEKGKTHCQFENPDKIRMLSELPGKDGYLGYIGITIPSDKLEKFKPIRDHLIKKMSIKQEDPFDNGYISNDWLEGQSPLPKKVLGRSLLAKKDKMPKENMENI